MKKFLGFIVILNLILIGFYSSPVSTQIDNQTGLGFNHHQQTVQFDDFRSWGNVQTRGETNWSTYTSCTGGATTESGTSLTLLQNRPGILSLYSGALAASYTCLIKDNDSVMFGGNATAGTGDVIYEAAFLLDVLSDGTDRYVAEIGLTDDMNCTGTKNNSLRISYSDNVNDGEFRCTAGNVVSATPTETHVDSGVVVAADTWYTVQFVVATNASNVLVYINDPHTPVCALTANIPSTGDDAAPLSPYFSITNSAGTDTNRRLIVDYTYLKQAFDTLR